MRRLLFLAAFLCAVGCMENLADAFTPSIPSIPGANIAPMPDAYTTPEEEEIAPDTSAMSELMKQKMQESMKAPALLVDPKDLVVGRYSAWSVGGSAAFKIACVGSAGLNKVVDYVLGDGQIIYRYYMNPRGRAIKAFVIMQDMEPIEVNIMGSQGLPSGQGIGITTTSGIPGARTTVKAAGRTFNAVMVEAEGAKVYYSDDVYFWALLKSEGEGGGLELVEMGDDAKPSVR